MQNSVTAPLEWQYALRGDVFHLKQALSRNPALVAAYSPDNQSTLLLCAVSSQNLSCVRMLVEDFGADVSQPSTQAGNSPLHQAVFIGAADITRYLLSRNAKVSLNAFHEYPADQLSKVCPSRTPEMSNATLAALREYRADSSSTMHTHAQYVQPVHVSAHATVSNAAASPTVMLSASLSVNTSQTAPQFVVPMSPSLPASCEQVKQKYPRLVWSATAADYVCTGLLPYQYRGGTYYTPVILYCSKQVSDGHSAAVMYRCLIDLKNLNGLAISSKAANVYLHPISGAVIPQPPYVYASFLEYVDSVVASFSKIPPLVDATSTIALSLTNCMSTDRRILMEISAFHDGALQYQPASHTVVGVIPVYPGNNRTFRPLACVPVKITLVHLTHGNSIQPPLVFVGPLDSDMVLVGTTHVDGSTGQVRGLVSLAQWNSSSSLTTLLLQMQDAFTSTLPIQHRGNLPPQQSQITPSPPTPAPAAVASPLSPPGGASSTGASNSSTDNEAMMCVICLSEPKRYIALPCRHLLFCSSCVEAFARQSKKECPICRSKISDLFEIYT